MEDQEKVEPEYVRGFNEGYLLSQHKPELAEKLANINSDFVRLAGFKDGHKQYQDERTKTRLPAWMKQERSIKQPDIPTKAKGRDRDIEPRE